MCANPPVRIAGFYDYQGLGESYNTSIDGDIIQAQSGRFSEDLVVDQNKSITLRSGYDCNYYTNTGETRINGNVIMSNGNIILDSGTLRIE